MNIKRDKAKSQVVLDSRAFINETNQNGRAQQITTDFISGRLTSVNTYTTKFSKEHRSIDVYEMAVNDRQKLAPTG